MGKQLNFRVVPVPYGGRSTISRFQTRGAPPAHLTHRARPSRSRFLCSPTPRARSPLARRLRAYLRRARGGAVPSARPAASTASSPACLPVSNPLYLRTSSLSSPLSYIYLSFFFNSFLIELALTLASLLDPGFSANSLAPFARHFFQFNIYLFVP